MPHTICLDLLKFNTVTPFSVVYPSSSDEVLFVKGIWWPPAPGHCHTHHWLSDCLCCPNPPSIWKLVCIILYLKCYMLIQKEVTSLNSMSTLHFCCFLFCGCFKAEQVQVWQMFSISEINEMIDNLLYLCVIYFLRQKKKIGSVKKGLVGNVRQWKVTSIK